MRQVGVEVDDAGDPPGRLDGHVGRQHAGIAVDHERDIAEILVRKRRRHIADVGAAGDLTGQQVGAFAKSDIRLVRGLLGQAELGAVKAARDGGKTWAEIATMLGVTKQTAWERRHDLDNRPTPSASTQTTRVSAERTDRSTALPAG